MNSQDRDALLGRLDERTRNTWRVTEAQDKKIDQIIGGQKVQNGNILKNTIWRKCIAGIGGGSLLVITGWLISLTLGGN